MRKISLIVSFVLSLAVGGWASAGDVSGSIGLVGPDYATLYGVGMDASEARSFGAPYGNFCGISRWSDLLNFLWTGWGYQMPIVWRAPVSDIWVLACIDPYTYSESLLYSSPYSLREGEKEVTAGDDDPSMIETLRQAVQEARRVE